ncbi:MAG: DUF1786 family protein [Candidatus Hodarchaeales archaeon]|jgi:uncharacterized protein (DUF1786 family)
MLELNEKVLAIDVGKGTEDIFYYNPERKLENSVQIVKPSRAHLLRQQLDNHLRKDYDIFVKGTIMGGEPWHIPLYKIAQTPGRDVIMTPEAAHSLRYDSDQVTHRGVKILEKLPYNLYSNVVTIESYDIDYQWYGKFFKGLEIDIFSECNVILIACQEHGYPGPNGGSAREFRMKECYQRFLDSSPELTSLMFERSEIPDFAWRLKANATLAQQFFPSSKVFVMDSSPAVILGTMLDPIVPEGEKTVINIGNGHTLVMILDQNWKVLAICEHHTGNLTTSKIDTLLEKLFSNKLSNELILRQGGHGFYQRIPEIPINATENIVVLGPNRKLLQESQFFNFITWSHPLGSMMLSGPAGLLKTYEFKKKSLK